MRGLNSRPLACEASVITTTPTRPATVPRTLFISIVSTNKHANLCFLPPLPAAGATRKRRSSRSEPRASASQCCSISYQYIRQHDRAEQKRNAVLVDPALHPPVQRIQVVLLPQQTVSHPRSRHSHQHVAKPRHQALLLRLLLLLQSLHRPPQREQRHQQRSHIDDRRHSSQEESHASRSMEVARQRREE